jgi:hypothetical protein
VRRYLALASALGLTVAVGLLFAFHRIQAALWSWRLVLLVSVGYLGFIALESIRAVLRPRKRISKVAVVILFLALTVHLLLLAPVFGEGRNVWTYKNWMWQANIESLQSLYLEPWAPAQGVYPPVSLYILNFIGWAYESIGGSIPVPLEEPTPPLAVLISLPGAMCNVLISLAIYLWIQPRKGDKWAHMAMAAFAFNPAVVLVSTRWGQMDSIHSLVVLLAVMSAMDRRPALSWALISLGTAVKPQALFFVPVVLVLTWLKCGWRSLWLGMLAAASTTIVVMSPFVDSGTWQNVVGHFTSLPAYNLSTHNAHNLWWLAGMGKSHPDTTIVGGLSLPVLGPLTYKAVGFSLFGIALLFALWRLASICEGGWMWATVAYVAFAFFMLPTKIHANYLYTVFPLLAMALSQSNSLRAVYVTLSATWLLNLALNDPAVAELPAVNYTESVVSMLQATAGMIAATVNTIALVWWTSTLIRSGVADPGRRAAGADH